MFGGLSLWLNLAIFAASAAVVWVAGTRVAELADVIARRTGLGHAVVGLLLLAGITSLPEIAVTVTASAGGNPQLAVNNLLGSVAMQVAILAVGASVLRETPRTRGAFDVLGAVTGTLAALLLCFGLIDGASGGGNWSSPAVLGERIKRVHVKGFNSRAGYDFAGFVRLLDGDVDWKKVMDALRGIGYDGWVTIEIGASRADPRRSLREYSADMDTLLAL